MECSIIQVAADKIVNIAIAPIGHELGYFINYQSNIQNLRTQVEKLKEVRERLQRKVDVVESNGMHILSGVQNKLTHIDEITAKVEKFFVEDQAKMTRAEGGWQKLKSRYHLGRKAKKMEKEVLTEILSEVKLDQVGYHSRTQVITTVASTAFIAFESRKLNLKVIMDSLKDSNINRIGVCGMSGMGKTTLVKAVINQAMEEKLFDSIIMVSVKENPDPTTIQGEMAEKLHMTLTEQTVSARAGRLYNRIKMEKKILVILDDLWAKLDLEEVGVPFGDAHMGCKILLTSRNRDVLTVEMDTQEHVTLFALSPDEALSLFENVVGDVRGDPNLQNVATKVAKSCAGLPVFIVTVAKALKGKDLNVWKDALKDLKWIDNEHTEVKDKVFSALKLSYNQLEGDEVKPVFLLCSLLPNFDIAIDYLSLCAMALGLFKHVDTLEEAKNRVHKWINVLKGQCLLLDGETNEQVKMYDLVREFASVASKDLCAYTNDWPKKDMLKECKMISLPSNKIRELPEYFKCPKLELLLLLGKTDDHVKIPKTFFKGIRNLKVMALSKIHFVSRPSLHFLENLKMLWFNCCVLGDIAVIGELKSLEILRLTECGIIELPKEIGQLTCLRLLDLSNNPELEVIPAGVISSLKNLEELYMANSFAQWEVEELNIERSNASLSEFKHLSELTNLKVHIPDAKIFPKDLLLEKLERYLILIGKCWENWNKGMDVTSRTLKLKSNSSDLQLEDGIKALLKKADSLYLVELNGIKHILDELEDKDYIQQLIELHVKDNAEIQYIINSRVQAPTFPVLQSIFLGSLSNLEKICHGQLQNGSFSNLRIVKVELCHKLKYLLPFSAVPGSFVQLQELVINECSIMSAVFAEEREDQTNGAILNVMKFPELRSLTMDGLPNLMEFCSHMETPSISSSTQESRPLFNQKVSFPKLEALKLCLINHEKIWDENLPAGYVGFQNLTRLIVESCVNLKYLLSFSNAKSLVQLNYLKICKCNVMEEVVTMEEGTSIEICELGEEGRWNKMFPKLESLKLKDLPNLSRFCAESLIEFSLKKLRINNCPELKTFISKSSSNATEPLFNELVAFPNLERMLISNMDNLVKIWHDQLTEGSFCNLRTISVVYCAKLETIFPTKLLRRFQNLETLQVGECYSLEEVSFSKLEAFKLSPTNLKKIGDQNLPAGFVGFQNLTRLIVQSCGNLKYLISSTNYTSLVQLNYLEICKCNIMKEVVKMEGTLIVMFPKLEYLQLEDLPNLSRFCARLLIEFPLKDLKIINCPEMKTFISESSSSDIEPLFNESVAFPKLERMFISKMDNLVKIWHDQLAKGSFCNLRNMTVAYCEKLQTIFPPNLLRRFEKLVALEVGDCCSLEEVFISPGKKVKVKHAEVDFKLEYLHLQNLWKLKHIWNENFPGSYTFKNLSCIVVVECLRLKYLIPASMVACGLKKKGSRKIVFPKVTTMHLQMLPELKSFCPRIHTSKWPSLIKIEVHECDKLRIFASDILSFQDQVHCDGGLENPIEQPLFLVEKDAFPELKELKLFKNGAMKEIWHDQVQDEFFPKLEVLELIFFTDKLAVFPPDFLHTLNTLKKLVVCDASFKDMLVPSSVTLHSLTTLEVSKCHGLVNLVTFSTARSLVQLTRLRIIECNEIGEIIADDGGEAEEEIAFNQLKCLELISLSNLTSFYSGRCNFKFSSLEEVIVVQCPKMNYLSRRLLSAQNVERAKGFEIKILVPSSITLHNLKILVAYKCHRLVSLVTSTTATSLVQLTRLSIIECNEIEEIIADDGGEAEEEIVFKQLKYLELRSLSNLTSFYSGRCNFKFPSLEKENVIVEQCPNVNILSLGLLSAQDHDEMEFSEEEDEEEEEEKEEEDEEEEDGMEAFYASVGENSESVKPISSANRSKTSRETTDSNAPSSEIEEEDMKAFYDSMGAKSVSCQPTSMDNTTHAQCNKSKPDQANIDNALEVVNNVLETRTFISACDPGCSNSFKSALEFLCGLDEHDGISIGMKPFVLQLSMEAFHASVGAKSESVKPASPAKRSETSRETTNSSNAPSTEIEEEDMKAFHDSMGAKSVSCQPTSMDNTTHAQCNKSKPDQANIDNALKVVNNVLETCAFISACDPGCSSSFKSALEFLCGLDDHDGISIGMKLLVLQLSKDFEMMTKRFNWANETIERRNKLIQSKVDTEFELNDNKEQFLKLSAVESDILIGISKVEGQIKKQQQQINSLTEQRNLAKKVKRAIFEDGKKLEDKLNEYVKKVGIAEKEKEIAERTKEELEEKWSCAKLNLMQIAKSLGANIVKGKEKVNPTD